MGEAVLYITLSETQEELQEVADSHGWSLDGITIRELVPSESELNPEEQYTMFHPADVELSETTKTILADVERVKPARVVFDSLSELRLLAENPLRYRRQILALKQFFAGRNCTVMMLDDLTSTERDLQVQSIAHGVVLLEQLNQWGRGLGPGAKTLEVWIRLLLEEVAQHILPKRGKPRPTEIRKVRHRRLKFPAFHGSRAAARVRNLITKSL